MLGTTLVSNSLLLQMLHPNQQKYPGEQISKTEKYLCTKQKWFLALTQTKRENTNRKMDSDKLCPLHKKDHPLPKCRTFYMKPLDERKAFLKENNICYKCCASFTHMAKDCKVKVQCSECNSERHCAALHPSPAPWQKETEPTAEHGGKAATIVSGPTEPDEITSK